MSEWLAIFQGAAFTLLIKGDIYKFITTVFGMTADEVGTILKNRLRNFDARKTAEAFAQIYKQIEDVGIEPHRVAPKLLFPIIDGISLEEDQVLQAKWLGLLASEVSGRRIRASYPKILSELDPNEARLLDVLYQIAKGKIDEIPLSDELREKINIENLRKELNIDQTEFNLCLANLIRLELCYEVPQQFGNTKMLPISPEIIYISNWGKDFVEAGYGLSS